MTERKEAEFLAERLIWVFRRSGREGRFTKPFPKLARPAQESITRQCGFVAELPVLACYHHDDCWALLSTRRLVWCDAGRVLGVGHGEIAEVTVDIASMQKVGKLAADQLVIRADDGNEFSIQLEAGPPLSGFWNTIRAVIEAPDVVSNPKLVSCKIRREVRELMALGPMPVSSSDQLAIERYEQALTRISAPVSEHEARALLACFGVDDCLGLAWALIHLIESASGTLFDSEPADDANEWVRLLWERATR